MLTLEVRGAFADVPDVREVPTPFTPAGDGHPLAPIAGPVKLRGAEPGDGVVVDLLEITPHGEGKTAILRDFGVLRRESREPVALACPIKDGPAGSRIHLPVLVPGALVFLADPHAAISDGIISGTGRPSRQRPAARTGLDRREAYMLLGIVGELRIGTSPRPVMAARLIIPRAVLDAARRRQSVSDR